MLNQTCLFCQSNTWKLAFEYTAPPSGENQFSMLTGDYHRTFWMCKNCGHYQASHPYELAELYKGNYNQSLYHGEKLRQSFERILSLPVQNSDNQNRIKFIQEFWRTYSCDQPQLLDVGSGTGVFPYAMSKAGWDCTASDPDVVVTQHLSELGLKALCGDFFHLQPHKTFSLLSFNKVLEHVADPISMLQKAHHWLIPRGWVYVELPDGEIAARTGGEREEFFIEHYHAFSAASWELLVQKSGFQTQILQRLQEPSGKYTLRGLCRRPD
jgi:SAM-dependent methyltransferase